MLPNMNPQIALLLGLVGAIGALKFGFLVAAFVLLMSPHGRLPFVTLATVSACKLGVRTIPRTDRMV